MSGGGEDDGADKPHEASERKLEEARKKGDIPKTADITAAAATGSFLLLALLPGGWVPPRLGELGTGLLARADSLGPLLLDGGTAMGGTILRSLGSAMAPALIAPGLIVLAILIAMKGLVFAPDKLQPKLSRVSPLSNAKNKFGISGLVEFAKSALKLAVYSTLLWLFLLSRMPTLVSTIGASPGQASIALLQMMVEFMALVVLIMVVIGGLDYFWQVFDHKRRQRMSHQELKEDHKQSEGDPFVKAQRRQRGHEIAMNQMLADVPKAAVVIVNPTHYAVALQWTPNGATAPICVAKGVDEVAARIREKANEAGVPIHSDPPTARALYAAIKIGEEITPEHYAPVAAAIRFAEAMRLKAMARGNWKREE